MASDRSLATLIRALHTSSETQDTSRLLSSAATLLVILSNPLNITLLTSQILTAPAVWNRPDGLQTCMRILGIFHSASVHKLQAEAAHNSPGQSTSPEGAPKEQWLKAVLNGADERSPRWRHLLVIGGLLLGFESQDRRGLPDPLRNALEGALVKATNLTLQEAGNGPELEEQCLTLVLNHTFDLLSNFERRQLNYNTLMPILIRCLYFSPEGLESGYFLGTIDADVVQVAEKRFGWSAKSLTYARLQRLSSRPLVSSMGPLSRLIAYAAANVTDLGLLRDMVNDLSAFTKTIIIQWRQNKLSEIDLSEETLFLTDEALQATLPVLWKILKTVMFATVIILQAVMGRVLKDATLAVDHNATFLAVQTLHILRNLYFISSRLGQNAFSQYTFIYLTAIDILSSYPIESETFLREIQPVELGRIPLHPLERCLDLYFLNTAEHFTLLLSPLTNEELLVGAATPYLAAGGNNHLLETFEAAHSVMLAVLIAPQSTNLTAKHLPFYVDALLKVFPQNLSPRQFRLAFKTLIQITAPPSPLAESQPLLPATLLELIYHRAHHAPTTPLPPPTISVPATTNTLPLNTQPLEHSSLPQEPPLSEQAVLTLTLIDALPFLQLGELDEWLPLAADLIHVISDPRMKRTSQERFWEVLSAGELDVDRAALCVAWWGTRGGREMVLLGKERIESGPYMSGGLAESKL